MMAEADEPLKVDPNAPRPWYFTNGAVIAVFLCVYPFVLPFVWLNPYYSSSRKVLLTFLILVVSALLIKAVLFTAS